MSAHVESERDIETVDSFDPAVMAWHRDAEVATAIEAQLGLGEMGPVWYGEADTLLLRSPQFFSRVRARVEAAEARALQTLRPHMGSLRALAARLVVERELGGEELRQALFLPAAPSHEIKGAPAGEEDAQWQ